MGRGRNRKLDTGRRNEGAALILAISVLALLAFIGTEYVRSMNLELEASTVDLRQARARLVAAAGVNAAIGALETARAAEVPTPKIEDKRYSFPTYGGIFEDGAMQFVELEGTSAEAVVTVADENGKINLNYASPGLLSEVLDISNGAARSISSALPPNNEEGRWFRSIDDLLTLGLISKNDYDAIPRNLATTDTVIHHGSQTAFINVNSLSPEVLSVIVGAPAAQEAFNAAERPFASIDALAEAAGKAPEDFRRLPELWGADSGEEALTTTSNCYRITSEATYTAVNGRRGTARVEAVVMFEDGECRVLRWTTDGVAAPAPPAEPAEEADAGENALSEAG